MVKLTRRQVVRQAAGFLFVLTPISAVLAEASPPPQFAAMRIWPTQTYTRITIEATRTLSYQHFTLDNPSCLVVDIGGASINSVLQGISSKVQPSDPHIRSVCAGRNTPTAVRVVIDLKQSVNTQVFTLTPVGGFKYRLVIDLYPQHTANSDDPIMALLNGNVLPPQTPRPSQQPEQEPYVPSETAPRRGGRRPIVMLDPGHGDEDLGVISADGLREKHVVLSIARGAKRRLEPLGYTAYMTHNEDVFTPLNVRVAKARTHRADVFVSIHADSFTNPTARGMGVYILNPRGAPSAATKSLVQTQNNADVVGGVQSSGNRHVDNAILDMTQTVTMKDSRRLDQPVLSQLGRLNKLYKERVDEANFAVLRAPDIPSILVETAFLSNLDGERLLASVSFRQQCTQAITTGIRRYLNTATLRR